METAGKLVITTTLRHFFQRGGNDVQQFLIAGFSATLNQQVHGAGMRKLRRLPEPPVVRVKLAEGELRGSIDLSQFGKPELLKDDEDDKTEFLSLTTATSLVVLSTGDFEIHYEETSGVYCMDGYWLAVQFTADRTPVEHLVEA